MVGSESESELQGADPTGYACVERSKQSKITCKGNALMVWNGCKRSMPMQVFVTRNAGGCVTTSEGHAKMRWAVGRFCPLLHSSRCLRFGWCLHSRQAF
eukprot:353481-Chlamydomonas_euryale.AAC.2